MSQSSLKTIIVDDEPLAVSRLRALCKNVGGIDCVGEAVDGVAALELITASSPHLILLDINMPGLSGLDVAKTCREFERPPAIIFTTAYADFALEAFAIDVVDYLLKPVKLDRLVEAVEKARRRISTMQPEAAEEATYSDDFWVSQPKGMVRVAAQEIEMIEADRDYMRLHVGGQSYFLHQSMKSLEENLDPDLFLRVHRSTIVRRDRMKGLRKEGKQLLLIQTDGREILVGPSYAEAVHAAISSSV